MDIKSLIRDIPDFPKPGIIFRDHTTLLQEPEALHYAIAQLAKSFINQPLHYVVGMEARGFIFGALLAYELKAGFVPVRKSGKLPGPVHSIEYELEYSVDRLEIHQDAIKPGSQVLIVDDLIATGGTARATSQLVQSTSGNLVGFAFIIELQKLCGRNYLPPVPIISLVKY